MNRLTLIDRLFPFLFSPDDDGGGGGGIGDVSDVAHGEQGDVEIMGRGKGETDTGAGDDDKNDDEGAGDGDRPEVFLEEEEEGSDKEKDDEEEKDEGKDDGEEEGVKDDAKIFQGRPMLTDLKKEYPKIFKQFPELREVIFREQELSKHFGTVEEAEEASIKAGSFNTIEAALLAGDPSLIFDQLGTNAPEALVGVVDNFLPKILAKSQDLYLRATTPVIEQFLWSGYEHGKRIGDANLMKSMQHAANFIFGKPEIPDPARRGKPTGPHPAEQKLEEERAAWQKVRYKEASTEISGAIDAELEKDIVRGLDPEKKLSDRQRRSLIKEIKDEIDLTLGKDTAFGKQMQALWKKAGSADYPRDQRASIQNAFLARAKALVPAVRARLRSEWFGERPNSGKLAEKDKQVQQPQKKRTIESSSGRASGSGPKRPPAPRDVDYTKTTDMDLIEGRFSRRK